MPKTKKFFCKFNFEFSESEIRQIKSLWKRAGKNPEATVETILESGMVFALLASYYENLETPPVKNLEVHSFDPHEGLV